MGSFTGLILTSNIFGDPSILFDGLKVTISSTAVLLASYTGNGRQDIFPTVAATSACEKKIRVSLLAQKYLDTASDNMVRPETSSSEVTVHVMIWENRIVSFAKAGFSCSERILG